MEAFSSRWVAGGLVEKAAYLGTKMARVQESVSPGVLKRNSLITTNTRHIGNSQEALIRLFPIPHIVCNPFIPKV